MTTAASQPVATGPAGWLSAAVARLAAAGITAARYEAELLAAHVLGVPRGRLLLAGPPSPTAERELSGLIARRATRIPLQYLIGAAFLDLELVVGPGVFVPRPETELLADWGLAALTPADTTVVDLCSGSGALAAAVAAAQPRLEVYAVERSPDALAYLRRNVSALGVTVVAADIADAGLLPELAGRVDLVLANPPYVPSGVPVAPEVLFDPADAVFAGPDGLALMPAVLATARRLLRPGGELAVEHDDTHGQSVPELFVRNGFERVEDHPDLADRPRFTTGSLPAVGGQRRA
jgi:release factor glutamine methyltransferase